MCFVNVTPLLISLFAIFTLAKMGRTTMTNPHVTQPRVHAA